MLSFECRADDIGAAVYLHSSMKIATHCSSQRSQLQLIVCRSMRVVQALMKQLDADLILRDAQARQLQKDMAPPLLTLLAAEPEIQLLALRNINLTVQRHCRVCHLKS